MIKHSSSTLLNLLLYNNNKNKLITTTTTNTNNNALRNKQQYPILLNHIWKQQFWGTSSKTTTITTSNDEINKPIGDIKSSSPISIISSSNNNKPKDYLSDFLANNTNHPSMVKFPLQPILNMNKKSSGGRNFLPKPNQTHLAYPDQPRIIGGSYPVRGPVVYEKPKRLQEISVVGPFVSVSPKKYNNVAQMIRGFTAVEAKAQLRFCPKSVATDAMEVLKDCVNKAKRQLDLQPEELIVGQAYINSKIVGSKPDYKSKKRQGKINVRVSRLIIHLYQHPALVPGFESTKLVFRSSIAGSNRHKQQFTSKYNVKKV
jgi:ribosomal protein L22